MTSPRPSAAYRLEIPAAGESIATARLFLGAVGQTLGWSAEHIDDAKLAVSEAVTASIAGQADQVTIEIDEFGTQLSVGPVTGQELSTGGDVSAAAVLGAIFESVAVDEELQRVYISMGSGRDG